MKQECRDPYQYNSIVKAIATGSSRMSEICSKTGLDTGLTTSYLHKLMSFGIVKKEIPFGTDSSRKTIYALEDSMFRFWYRFIPDNLATINRGLTDVAYKKVAPQITSFMCGVFEEICKQYLWELNRQGIAAITFTDLGRWWGNDPKTSAKPKLTFWVQLTIKLPFSANVNGLTKMLTLAFLIRLLKEVGCSILPMFIFIYSQKQASPKAV